ncbi:MAG: C10 family peptidase [Bacteroidota bacterium]
MKKFAFFSICLLFTYHFYAQVINQKTAEIVALNFFYQQINNFEQRSYDKIAISDQFLIAGNQNQTLYYVFNIQNGGFVAIAGHQASTPVLFYSFKGNYQPDYQNPAFHFWTEQYKNQLNHAINDRITPDQNTINKWNQLITEDITKLTKNREKAIPPLLLTEWNQGGLYNELCPVDPNGPAGHAYAGCVATAMGQVMYYHKWPETGTGSFSYYHIVYDTISADFGSSTYQWDAMLNRLSDSNLSLALLLFHLGVSVTMNYGPNGSGMWNHSAAYSLRTYFKYCNETQYIFRDSTTLDWDSILVANLDAKKPMYYAGWADDTSFTSGHAFVCDGYQSPGFYHFNWGWGGSYDGFFYTDNLTPGGSQFTFAQEVIKDIYPDTTLYTYPENCTGLKTVEFDAGTLNDGSYGADYQNNLNCTYLIAPQCGSSSQMVFDRFELAPGDTVSLFDGQSDTGLVLGIFTYDNMPVLSSEINTSVFSPPSNNLFIRFKTDNQDTYSGWDVSYESFFCITNQTITDTTGILNDGSGSCNYKNSTSCKWTIQPPGVNTIYLNFTEFDLAPNTLDLLAVYKDAITAGNLIAKFDHTNIPSNIIVPSGTCILWFRTSSTETAGGWTCEYTGYNVSANEIQNKINSFSIYPNPFSEKIYLNYYLQENTDVTISVTNLLGQIIADETFYQKEGIQKILLNDIYNNFNEGVYYVNIKTPEFLISKKIISLSR